MKILRLIVFGVGLLWGGALFAADANPGWQATWEKTVAAAKKEGKFNIYVGRYGTEPLLNEFRKEYPDIKIISVNGTGNQLGTRIVTEMRSGKVIADLFSGGANTNFEILYKGKALDSIRSALILPDIRLHSESIIVWFLLQHDTGQPKRVQVLLGFGDAEMERKIRFPGADKHRPRRRTAILLLQSGTGS